MQAPFKRVSYRPRPETAEEALVAAAKYGDPAAFDALIERYAPRLHAVARRLVGADAAADAVQETFIAAHRGIGGFRGGSSFSTWLHSILVHRCRRVGKRRRSHDALPESLTSCRAGPQQHAEGVMLRELLERALGELPQDFRAALALREFSELSYEEIGAVLELRPGTVKSRIARARAHLREVLEREGVGP